MRASPRVLLVGAGAVGQVFARYLQAAGCEVSFLVKPSHAAAAREGFTLHAFRGLSRVPRPLSLSGAGVHVGPDEVAARTWEQVWLCVPSSALRAGAWVAELARATGGATWVMLQPALEDRDWLLQWVPAERLVCGNIPFLSFAAPLVPGAVPASGTAFWLPPLARGLFSGPAERREDVLRTLRAGGFPARSHRDVPRAMAVFSAVLTALVAGLEAAGWRFGRLLEREHLDATARAAREAARIAAAHTRTSAAVFLLLLRPPFFKLLPLVARLVPFDLEAYLRVHFTKVRAQSRLMLEEYVRLGGRAGLPVENLEGLLQRGAPPGG